MLPLLCAAVVATLFSTLALAEEVSLWQFGPMGRLLPGAMTLPLVPQGTGANGAATTFLYQVVNPATTVVQEGAVILTKHTVVTATRTIVASASGWFEPFPTHNIHCHFVGRRYGQCEDGYPTTTTVANSGMPHAVVLPVSAAFPAFTTGLSGSSVASLDSSEASTTITAPSTTNSTSTSNSVTAPIVGGVVGAISALTVAGLLYFCVLRRNRYRFRWGSDWRLRRMSRSTDVLPANEFRASITSDEWRGKSIDREAYPPLTDVETSCYPFSASGRDAMSGYGGARTAHFSATFSLDGVPVPVPAPPLPVARPEESEKRSMGRSFRKKLRPRPRSGSTSRNFRSPPLYHVS
ncbi:hypothetical protein MKEN_00843000 [Mycena kentingensis (nom. inval.)]|nr:hypothetical protein MKEN_00843000 [Mycena kentingensis (nom. inval.)]